MLSISKQPLTEQAVILTESLDNKMLVSLIKSHKSNITDILQQFYKKPKTV